MVVGTSIDLSKPPMDQRVAPQEVAPQVRAMMIELAAAEHRARVLLVRVDDLTRAATEQRDESSERSLSELRQQNQDLVREVLILKNDAHETQQRLAATEALGVADAIDQLAEAQKTITRLEKAAEERAFTVRLDAQKWEAQLIELTEAKEAAVRARDAALDASDRAGMQRQMDALQRELADARENAVVLERDRDNARRERDELIRKGKRR